MKLLILGCKTMREGVLASFVFFFSGILLVLAAQHVIPNIWNMQHITMFFGFIMILLSPLILLSTFLLTILARRKEEEENCEH
ncbi:MAG: hypothetical protein ABW162_09715 [Candidatus Sedimenticola sp. PURPLELP]